MTHTGMKLFFHPYQGINSLHFLLLLLRSEGGQRVYIRMVLLLLLAISAGSASAQISPGPLSSAHADLEGMSNCTLCHELGNKVSDAKCLDCHDEIQALINLGRGYHAQPKVKRQDCFECHSEHHGRRFDATRFDQDNFDHDLTGYGLEGEHAAIDCRECHKPDNISDREIRARSNTFLGMDHACLSCHDDYHQGSLDNDCASCHGFNEFAPAAKFDHNETEYPLRGAHSDVDCESCHPREVRNGHDFQAFSGIAFNDCRVCHDDPHRNQLAGACAQCHSVSSFSDFRGNRGFNHSRTGFELRGSHRKVDCFICHTYTSDPVKVFQDQDHVEETNCVSCHEDQHEGRYGTDCARCHQESSFLALKDISFFDHSVADFHLEGKHQEVDCQACHTERFSTPIDFSNCYNCHEDYHQGEFVSEGKKPDCNVCHSLNQGFEYSLFTIEQHQESEFPLDGAHLATPCFACHISEEDEKWHFRKIGNACVDCHQDIHEGYIADRFYPEDDCRSCHSSEAWASVDFDHAKTDWPLTGQHEKVACRKCHFEVKGSGSDILQHFEDLDHGCISCHENVHGDEFAIDGVTDCERCHVTRSWMPEKFDHDLTRFPLEGRHAEIECGACHEIALENGEAEVIYKLNKLECIDCHQ